MKKELSNKWWLILIKGIVGIVLGLILISYPLKTQVAITWFIGVFALIEGVITTIIAIINHKKFEHWGLILIQGLFGILIGLILFAWPAASLGILLFLVSIWLIVLGIILIFTAIALRKEDVGEWLIAAGGIIFILIGIFLLSNPQLSLALVGVIFGVSMLFSGIMNIGLGFQLRNFK